MLDHMTFRATDIGIAKAFYSAALASLGYSLSFEGNYGLPPGVARRKSCASGRFIPRRRAPLRLRRCSVSHRRKRCFTEPSANPINMRQL